MQFFYPIPRILEVRFETSVELCKTAYRFSHFYEFQPFKGTYFSKKSLNSYYKEVYGDKDFWIKSWSGANLPDYVFKPFFEGHFNPIGKNEIAVLSEVSKFDNNSPFYVIFTSEDALECRNHELAHGLFYVYPEYRAKVLQLLQDCSLKNPEEYQLAKDELIKMGYDSSVLEDELHTYCGVHYAHYFHPSGISIMPELRKDLIELFESYTFKKD